MYPSPNTCTCTSETVFCGQFGRVRLPSSLHRNLCSRPPLTMHCWSAQGVTPSSLYVLCEHALMCLCDNATAILTTHRPNACCHQCDGLSNTELADRVASLFTQHSVIDGGQLYFGLNEGPLIQYPRPSATSNCTVKDARLQ